jgi:hypothetical protein
MLHCKKDNPAAQVAAMQAEAFGAPAPEEPWHRWTARCKLARFGATG